jgi:hypothetical protein
VHIFPLLFHTQTTHKRAQNAPHIQLSGLSTVSASPTNITI